MKLSRSMAYAIHALLQLSAAEDHRPVACNLLARDGGMPARFLLQVLRSLVNHGILRSTRGVDGGYLLARPPHEISLLDIHEAIDTPIVPGIPTLVRMPEQAEQQLALAMQGVAACLRRELSRTTIADLLPPKRVAG